MINLGNDGMKNLLRRFIYPNIIWWPLIAIFVGWFYKSGWSLYWGGPWLRSLFRFFYYPFVFLPKSFFIGGRDIFDFKIPQIIGAFLVVMLTAVGWGWLVRTLVKRLKLKEILFLPITVILLCGLGLIGHWSYMNNCVANYENNSAYLHHTGLVHFVFSSQGISSTMADYFYQMNNMEYISGKPDYTRIIAKVTPGTEFKTICKIKAYDRISEVTRPLIVEDVIFGPNQDIRENLDSSFCDTGQIEKNQCLEYLNR